MTDTTNSLRPGSIVCTTAALGLIGSGIAALLSGSVGAGLWRAAISFPSLPVPLQAFGAVVLISACICASSLYFGRQALLWGALFAWAATGACVLGGVIALSVVGWALASGVSPSPRLLAFGSPASGLGTLAILFGIIALVWCRTPSTPSARPWAKRARTAGVTAIFLLVVPGVVAFAHGEIQGRISIAAEAVQQGTGPRG